MSVTVYHNPRCSKSRATLELLQKRGLEPEIVKYLEAPPEASELRVLARKLDLQPKEFLRTGESAWKELGLEVVFISLDVDKERFKNLAEPFPFISICDYKKWDSQAVKDYYVFATPSMYLLDSKRRIMLRPNSVRHLKAWVDQNLVQGDAMNEFN